MERKLESVILSMLRKDLTHNKGIPILKMMKLQIILRKII